VGSTLSVLVSLSIIKDFLLTADLQECSYLKILHKEVKDRVQFVKFERNMFIVTLIFPKMQEFE
jgi:hypothetical protein